MPMKALWKLNTLFLMLLTAACSYSVSVNDRVVYTPPTLFMDYQIADDRLALCVQQTIADKKVANARDLKVLNCSNAGIRSLSGLEVFVGLQEINLAHNAIRTLEPLATMSQIKVLMLNNNDLRDISPLLALLHLQSLDLSENPALPCNDIRQLEKNWAGLATQFNRPKQCS